MRDAIDDDDDEEAAEKKEETPGLRAREKESGKVRACRLRVRHYGNSRCEGMCCSLEAVGGRVAACIDDSPLTKEHPVPRAGCVTKQDARYAWNPIESVLKFFN